MVPKLKLEEKWTDRKNVINKMDRPKSFTHIGIYLRQLNFDLLRRNLLCQTVLCQTEQISS
jgi:hypothetical protein